MTTQKQFNWNKYLKSNIHVHQDKKVLHMTGFLAVIGKLIIPPPPPFTFEFI